VSDAAAVLADQPLVLGRSRHRQDEEALAEELDAAVGRALVLPAEHGTERLARALEDDGRAALVRHADGGEIGRPDPRRSEGSLGDLAGRVENPPRVLLDPSGTREARRELAVGFRDHLTACVDDRRPDAGRPFVQSEDVLLSRRRHRGEPAPPSAGAQVSLPAPGQTSLTAS
jgi:hypothetical protein